MQEMIGHVILDTRWDQDKPAEDPMMAVLLDVVKHNKEEELNQVIANSKSYPVLYHMSHMRENVLDWLPMTGEETVLELGAACGAVTGALIRKAGQVTCVDASLEACLVNAHRHRDCDHLTIIPGDFKAMEASLGTFDVITMIGGFEAAGICAAADITPEDCLILFKKHLNPKGRLVIAMDNRMGLKYFAGTADERTGTYFHSLDGSGTVDGNKLFTKGELEAMIHAVGGYQMEFYYPYPDYRFPMAIYSDAWLPKPGELNILQKDFKHLNIRIFDEGAVYDDIIRNHVFPQFSNAFIIVLEKED